MSDVNFDPMELERAAFVHFMAGMDESPWPLQEVWPGAPGKAYIYEMIRRTYGWGGAEYARTLKIFT